MNFKILAPVCGLAFLAVPLAHAQDDQGAQIGPYVGLYLPQSRELRNIFGDTILNFGIGPIASSRPAEGKIRPEISAIAASKNGSKFFILPVTAAYEVRFNRGNERTVPYARATAGAAYMDYAITRAPGVRASRKTVGFAGGLEVGVLLNRNLGVSAKYNVFSKQQGIDFNGLSFNLSFSLARF
jgi:hypothetical protein